MPHRSLYANDPLMQAPLHLFTQRLPEQAHLLRHPPTPEDLRRTLHQLKGAGRSFGFPEITTLAQATEAAVLAGRSYVELLGSLIEFLEDVA